MRRLLPAVLAIGLLAGACGSGGTTVREDLNAADTSDAGLLSFSAPAVADGEPVDLSVYAGQDLVVWFWAPW